MRCRIARAITKVLSRRRSAVRGHWPRRSNCPPASAYCAIRVRCATWHKHWRKLRDCMSPISSGGFPVPRLCCRWMNRRFLLFSPAASEPRAVCRRIGPSMSKMLKRCCAKYSSTGLACTVAPLNRRWTCCGEPAPRSSVWTSCRWVGHVMRTWVECSTTASEFSLAAWPRPEKDPWGIPGQAPPCAISCIDWA